MFKSNKYTNWYFSIIEKARARLISDNDYYEVHHIIPKSLGGTNRSDNLIKLSAREHYVVHLLLMKMCDNKTDTHKMSCAFHFMSLAKNEHTSQRYNSKIYEYHSLIRTKIQSDRMKGAGNSLYGKKHSAETKRKISEKRKSGLWEPNTEQTKQKKRDKWLTNNPNNDPLLMAKLIEKRSKIYQVTSPSGEVQIIKNLSNFCKENRLSKGCMCMVAKGIWPSHKGWKVLSIK